MLDAANTAQVNDAGDKMTVQPFSNKYNEEWK